MFPKLDPSTLKDTQYPDAQAQELPFAAAKRLKTPDTSRIFLSARKSNG
jgi:hypothetical protein